MKDFPFIWLLFNTKTGKTILGIFIAYIVIRFLEWWIVPIIAAVIAVILLYEYYTVPKIVKEDKNSRKTKLIIGICLLTFALLFALGILYHQYWERHRYDELRYYIPPKTEKVIDDGKASIPGNVVNREIEKREPVKHSSYSSSSGSQSYSSNDDNDNDDDDENMRGWDPASEDDMDDNGMDRYIENTDEEGWD